MHPVERFMARRGVKTQAEFARRAGLSPQYLNDLIRGRAKCGREGACKIVQASDGEITLEELLTWVPPKGRAA